MSINSLQSSLNQIDREIADLEKKLAESSKAEANKTNRIGSIQKSISRYTSASSVSSKLRQIESLQNEISRLLTNKANINKKIAEKRKRRNDLNLRLQKEERNIAQKRQKETEDMQAQYEQQIKELKSLLNTNPIVNNRNSLLYSTDTPEEFDVFISHASEDKESFVTEFVNILQNKFNLKVWYDDLAINWGDSIRVKIDNGLKKSKFGIVILSKNYIAKHWTQYELEGLFQREAYEGKLILPIWHNITKSEIQAFSPVLAGKLAYSTGVMTSEEIGQKLFDLLNSSRCNK